jgi:hypothetical protein
MRLLLRHQRGDAAGRIKSAGPRGDRLSDGHLGDVQGVDVRAAVQSILSRAWIPEDPRQRRFQHCAARCDVGRFGYPDLLPGAARQRELSADRDAAVFNDAAQPVDWLSTIAGGFRVDLSCLHDQGGDRATDRSHHDGHHHSGGHTGSKCPGAGPDAAILRDVERHSRQARLERIAGTDRLSMAAAEWANERLPGGHRDPVESRRRHSDRRRRAPQEVARQHAMGRQNRQFGATRHHQSAHPRQLVGGPGCPRQWPGADQSRRLCATPTRGTVWLQRHQSADARQKDHQRADQCQAAHRFRAGLGLRHRQQHAYQSGHEQPGRSRRGVFQTYARRLARPQLSGRPDLAIAIRLHQSSPTQVGERD